MPGTRGSIWRKWDFHIHTPESFQWKGGRFQDLSKEGAEEFNQKILEEIVKKIMEVDVDAFVVMDYWTFDGYKKLINYIKTNDINLGGKLILPGIELRVESPVDFRMNIHAILSEKCTFQELDDFKSKLELQNIEKPLSENSLIQFARTLSGDKVRIHGSTKEKVDSDDSEALKVGSATALVSKKSLADAHKMLDLKSLIFMPWDTSDGLTGLDWKKHPADVDYFMKKADIFEARHEEQRNLIMGIKTEENKSFFDNFKESLGGRAKLAVSGSDAHAIADYGVFPKSKPTWIKADLSFDGLKQVCIEPSQRCYIGEVPSKLKHYQLNPGKYIDTIAVSKSIGATTNELWFDFEIPLNNSLISIIGNKGSGKSALADILGFVGNTKVGEEFMSFLNEKRFKRDGGRLAGSFEVKGILNSGQVLGPIRLSDPVSAGSEYVRYIPQSYLEDICNELEDGEDSNFEKELKKVIYSHIPEESRLGTDEFDDLLLKKTSTVQDQIKTIKSSIDEKIILFADQYKKSRPRYISDLNKKLEDKKKMLKELDRSKPKQVTNPLEESEEGTRDYKLGKISKSLNERKNRLSEDLGNVHKELKSKNQILQGARDGLSKIDSSYDEFINAIKYTIASLSSLNVEISFDDFGIEFSNLVLKKIIKSIESDILRLRGDLEPDNIKSLAYKQSLNEERIKKLNNIVEEKVQLYNEYLVELKKWDDGRCELVGDEGKTDSIKNLEKRLKECNAFGESIDDVIKELIEESLKVFNKKLEQLGILEQLYGSVQEFSNTHPIIKDKPEANLEFESKVVIRDFIESFLSQINQNSKGSFYGVQEGRDLVLSFVKELESNMTIDGVRNFLETITSSLFYDKRKNDETLVDDISKQLKKNSSIEELFREILFLNSFGVTYGLRMNGRQMGELSPGEKGLLLLIFYTLLDKDDVPLIIDQPEENLDNETIKEVLVPCLTEAKNRRQVLIVTHNPNLAIVCDSEQIIHADMFKLEDNKIVYTYGSIEDSNMTKKVVDVLEGTMFAFDNRGAKYKKKIRY